MFPVFALSVINLTFNKKNKYNSPQLILELS